MSSGRAVAAVFELHVDGARLRRRGEDLAAFAMQPLHEYVLDGDLRRDPGVIVRGQLSGLLLCTACCHRSQDLVGSQRASPMSL